MVTCQILRVWFLILRLTGHRQTNHHTLQGETASVVHYSLIRGSFARGAWDLNSVAGAVSIEPLAVSGCRTERILELS